MKPRSKRFLVLLFVFGAGFGFGTIGGYVLNDVTSREDPNAIQQIRQELEEQQRLDDFFAQQQAEQPRASRNGGSGEPSSAESSSTP